MTAQTRQAAFCARAAIASAQKSAFIASPTPAQWAVIDSRAAAAAKIAATPSQAGATRAAQAGSAGSFIANPTPAQWTVIDAQLAAKDAACPRPPARSTSNATVSAKPASPAAPVKAAPAARRPARPARPRRPRAVRAR